MRYLSPMTTSDQRGFTLPELLVATAAMLVFMLAAVTLLRPMHQDVALRDAARRLDVALMAQALNRFRAETGRLPANLPTEATGIGSVGLQYDLCTVLVPRFLKDLPLDPQHGGKYAGEEATTEACNKSDVQYTTGYSIRQAADGVVLLAAPGTEGGRNIEVRLH